MSEGFFKANSKKIKGIEVYLSENNHLHQTRSPLFCDVCKKEVSTVTDVLIGKTHTFLCMKCLVKPSGLYKLVQTTVGDIWMCGIENLDFDNTKKAVKRIRSEMTLSKRFAILKRDNFRCVLCGRRPPEVTIFVDHIKPVSKGGDNTPSNLRTLCFDCNMGRGNRQ